MEKVKRKDHLGEGPWVIVTDDEGHVTIIPDSKRHEWEDYLRSPWNKDFPEWAYGSPGGTYWFLINDWEMRDH